jgi:hypothetical protein
VHRPCTHCAHASTDEERLDVDTEDDAEFDLPHAASTATAAKGLYDDVYDNDTDDCVNDDELSFINYSLLINYMLYSLPYLQAAFNWLFYAYLNKSLCNRHNKPTRPVIETSLSRRKRVICGDC